MLINISEDEHYPVYEPSIVKCKDDEGLYPPVKVTEKMYKKWVKVIAAYNKAQGEMERLLFPDGTN